MNITIGIIKVNYINNLGSMNIGKTIICRNQTIESSFDKGSAPILDEMKTNVEAAQYPK
jgi:hypothetical protein